MNNKAYWVVLLGGLISIISIIGSATNLLPGFIAPFVCIVYGLAIFYMSR